MRTNSKIDADDSNYTAASLSIQENVDKGVESASKLRDKREIKFERLSLFLHLQRLRAQHFATK